jgi:hypothetical protein
MPKITQELMKQMREHHQELISKDVTASNAHRLKKI